MRERSWYEMSEHCSREEHSRAAYSNAPESSWHSARQSDSHSPTFVAAVVPDDKSPPIVGANTSESMLIRWLFSHANLNEANDGHEVTLRCGRMYSYSSTIIR